MFEALRGLRDAVAPESGNLGNNNNNPDEGAATEPDVEELWQAYCNGDEAVIALVNKFSTSTKVIQRRDDFLTWHAVMEREKDAELVEILAAAVLEKSDQIDSALLHVPGMHRTREQQLKYIEELIKSNADAAAELETVYKAALLRRDDCRQFVHGMTSVALGIEEED